MSQTVTSSDTDVASGLQAILASGLHRAARVLILSSSPPCYTDIIPPGKVAKGEVGGIEDHSILASNFTSSEDPRLGI